MAVPTSPCHRYANKSPGGGFQRACPEPVEGGSAPAPVLSLPKGPGPEVPPEKHRRAARQAEAHQRVRDNRHGQFPRKIGRLDGVSKGAAPFGQGLGNPQKNTLGQLGRQEPIRVSETTDMEHFHENTAV